MSVILVSVFLEQESAEKCQYICTGQRTLSQYSSPMKTTPLTKEERAYVAAHKEDAEKALSGLIRDVKLARSHLAAHLAAFNSIAEFLQEALAEPDAEKMRAIVKGTISVAENYSIPMHAVFKECLKASMFDPADKAPAKRSRKPPVANG